MRKVLLMLAAVALLGAGAFVGTAQADHGRYGGYGYGGYGYGRGYDDCYPGYRSSYYYRPYSSHYHQPHYGHGHHHHGGGVHLHGRGFGIHLGF
jgi:hypothetical protein